MLNIDNNTAVAHINKSGGTRSPQLLKIVEDHQMEQNEENYVRRKISTKGS
jgi:hypothetical protein